MAQFFARPWDGQPQEDTGLSLEFPPAAFVHLPSTQAELVRGATLTTDKPARSAGRHGIAYSSTGLGGRSARSSALKTSNGAGTGDFTVLVFAAPVSAAGRIMPFCISGASGESYFIFNANTTLGTLAGSFTYTSFGAESSLSASGVDGQTHVFVVRRLAGVLSLWRDGISLASGSWTANIGSAGASYDYIAGFSGAGYSHVDPIYLVAGWNSALKDQQLNDLVNPWRLFEPRRLYIPTAAGAAGSNTIAVPSGAIVLAGFAPVVTATANQTIAVPAGTLTLSAFAPTVTAAANQTIAVPAGALVLAAFAPTVSATANNSISVPAGALTLAGYAPTVTSNASNTIAVPAGSLSLAAYAPDVLASTNYVSVPAGALTITGFAPTVSDGAASGFIKYFDVLSGKLLILRAL